MNQTTVSLQINIPAEWLVTNQTNKFLNIQATVLPITRAVLYDKVTTDGLTMFAFRTDMMHNIIQSIDDLCRQEADRIDSGIEDDEVLYHEIAQYGI